MKPVEDKSLHPSIKAKPQSTSLLLSLFLLTFSGLALEVCLTRLYSAIFLHTYVYLLISLSMAGLGFGAVLIYYIKDRIQGLIFNILVFLPLLSFTFLLGLSFLNANVVVSLIPTILLFICIGSANTLIFQRSKISLPLLYGIDLCGAATGALCSYYLLNFMGAVKSVLLAIVLIVVATSLLQRRLFGTSTRGLLGKVIVVIIAASLMSLDFNLLVTPRHNRLKDMSRVLADKAKNPRVVATRWTAFGRSDLVETDNPLMKTLYIDGAAGTKMLHMPNGVLPKELHHALRFQFVTGIALLPIPAEERDHALVVGSGGGIDVVTLLTNDYRRISAVEINPDFIALVKQYRQYNGGIYNNHPQVSLFNQEGRSFIRSSDRKFDLILMSLPILKSARNVGSYSLTENHLFTFEAFNEYWRALNDNGYLVIVAHYPGEVYRLVTNAIKAFETRGVNPPLALQHMILIGRDTAPALIMRKKPFSKSDAETYYGMIRTLRQEGTTNFIPHVAQHSIEYREWETNQVKSKTMINPGLYALSKAEIDLSTFIARDPENIGWISDDSPFFYQLDKGIPKEILIVLSFAILIFVIFIILFLRTPEGHQHTPINHLIGFSCIGIAFIMIEIGVIQKFILFWSHQTLALAFLLALILISAGMGSLTSRLLIDKRFSFEACVGFAIVMAILFHLVNGPVLSVMESKSALWKMAGSIILVGPLFFILGFPFPLLLTRVKEQGAEQLFPWMIGINSITTLLGGVMAIGIAIQIGYQFVLLSGAGSYTFLLCWYVLVLGRPNPIQRSKLQEFISAKVIRGR